VAFKSLQALGAQPSGWLRLWEGALHFLPFYAKSEKGDQGVISRCALGKPHSLRVFWHYCLPPEALASPEDRGLPTERLFGFDQSPKPWN